MHLVFHHVFPVLFLGGSDCASPVVVPPGSPRILERCFLSSVRRLPFGVAALASLPLTPILFLASPLLFLPPTQAWDLRFAFLSMFTSNIWHDSVPLQDIRLQNLDLDLSTSLKVKYDGIIGLVIYIKCHIKCHIKCVESQLFLYKMSLKIGNSKNFLNPKVDL